MFVILRHRRFLSGPKDLNVKCGRKFARKKEKGARTERLFYFSLWENLYHFARMRYFNTEVPFAATGT